MISPFRGPTREFPTLETRENVEDYSYRETVLVHDPKRDYVKSLEGYFRTDSGVRSVIMEGTRTSLVSLKSAIKRYEKSGHFFWSDRHIDVVITKDNYEPGLEWLEAKLELEGCLDRAQKINHGRIREVLLGRGELEDLDLTNYGHRNHIVRIGYSDEGHIRMRVFYSDSGCRDLDPWRPRGRGDKVSAFAEDANWIRGVEARVIDEGDVDEDIPTLSSFVKNKASRSRLRVKPPEIDLHQEEDKMVYSFDLSEAEMRMLEILGKQGGDRSKNLHDASPLWSQGQAKKLIRNLYGVTRIYDSRPGDRTIPYHISIDEHNKEDVKKAMENGGRFTKTVEVGSLPALDALFRRTIELKKKYRWSFYPRFSVTEVSNISGEDKERTEESLDNLVGVLCPVREPYHFSKPWGDSDYVVRVGRKKWMLPKTRINLAGNMLRLGGFEV